MLFTLVAFVSVLIGVCFGYALCYSKTYYEGAFYRGEVLTLTFRSKNGVIITDVVVETIYHSLSFEPFYLAKDLSGDVWGVYAEHQLSRDSIEEDNLEINK